MKENIVLGVDIGGSHITASLVDIQNKEILASTFCRAHVDGGGSAESIVATWKEALLNCAGAHDIQQLKIGIAMPGPVDYEQGFCYIKGQNKYENLYGRNLKELLASALGIVTKQVKMINDAAGFLSGEMFIGAGRGYQKVIGLTLGTGLGSAFHHAGKTIDADLWQSPFREGKAEDYLSAPRLLNFAKYLTGQSFDNVKQMAEIADSNPSIQSVFANFGIDLAHFLGPIIKKEGPELLILGGNVAKAYSLFQSPLNHFLQVQDIQIPVHVAEIGESAALVGAAALWESRA